jgi:amino acid adenylation domain-containing protein
MHLPGSSVSPLAEARANGFELCLHEWIERTAAAHPDRIAVCSEARQITFQDLNERANRLARYLQARGVGCEKLVGICMERSIHMLVAMLGVLKAGAAYVPLDPFYPRERIAHMIADSGLAVLLMDQSVALEPSEKCICTIKVDKDWPEIALQECTNLPPVSSPDHLAYVIYTSGSTGKPKGVMIEHRAVVNFLRSMQIERCLTQEDRVLAITTLSFDIAVLELWLPLCVGAQTVIASRETAHDPIALAELIRNAGITVMQATPATWRMLLETGWPGDKRLKALCGAEAWDRSLADKLLPCCAELWNMYGPTETTVWSAVCRIEANSDVVIGPPIANTSFYVLDEERRPVQKHEPGELYIAGEGVARGYWQRPDITAEKFIEASSFGLPGGRLYRTGDLVRRRSDGRLHFLGRIDHQVKIRGFRIELGEIEAALSQINGVRESVVVAREDQSGAKRLVAYIAGSRSFTAQELRSRLEESFPDYMVPNFFVTLESLPRTPNGKVDRDRLPAPSSKNPVRELPFAPPRTAAEKKLTAICLKIIPVRSIGLQDDLFDLGADSLQIAQICSQIVKEFGVRITPSTVLECPTVEQLAAAVMRKRSGAQNTSLVPLQPQGSRPPLFGIHGSLGTVMHFRSLARHLDPEQPMFGLQAKGIYYGDGVLTTVEEMATHYLSEIRTVQAHGPYYLVGHCFGILVALEMAQRLRAAGEEVALLAGINGPIPGYSPAPEKKASQQTKLRGLRRIQQGIRWRWRAANKALDRRITKVRVQYHSARKILLPEKLRRSFFVALHDAAELRYQPKPYAGTMTVICADEKMTLPTLGWDKFAATAEDYRVPGGREPDPAAVAAVLQRKLAAARDKNDKSLRMAA